MVAADRFDKGRVDGRESNLAVFPSVKRVADSSIYFIGRGAAVLGLERLCEWVGIKEIGMAKRPKKDEIKDEPGAEERLTAS